MYRVTVSYPGTSRTCWTPSPYWRISEETQEGQSFKACRVNAETARAVADLVSQERGLSIGQVAGLILSKNSGATLVSADKALEGRAGVLYVGQGTNERTAGDPALQR